MFSLLRKRSSDFSTVLKAAQLKDTAPRRIVLEALYSIAKPTSPYDVQRWLAKKSKLNVPTIYRVLDALTEAQLVHRHPCDGRYSLCTLHGQKGHHGFLHCKSCGKVEEFLSASLCKIENTIARSAKFKPTDHVSEIVGICRLCHA